MEVSLVSLVLKKRGNRVAVQIIERKNDCVCICVGVCVCVCVGNKTPVFDRPAEGRRRRRSFIGLIIL